MAVTSIWPITVRLNSVIKYACNPEKTTQEAREETSQLHKINDVVQYTANNMKTEQREFASGINCNEEYAADDFMTTKRHWDLYCVMKDKNATDGITDIMVRAEDSSKINRIFERFKLASVDIGRVKSTIERQHTEKPKDIPAPERTAPVKSKEDLFIEELLRPAPTKEENQTKNPTEARVAKSRQSEPCHLIKLSLHGFTMEC